MVILIQNSVEAHPHVLQKASSKQPRMLFNSLCVCVAYCISETAASHTTTWNTTKSSSGASIQGILSTNFLFLKQLQLLYVGKCMGNPWVSHAVSVPVPIATCTVPF